MGYSTRTYRWYLIAAMVAVFAGYWYQYGYHSRHSLDTMTRLTQFKHYYWWSLAYSAVAPIAIIFTWPIYRAFGGWSSLLGRGTIMVWAGVTSWSIGNMTWFWYNTCTFWASPLNCSANTVSPYPSVGDWFYLGMFVFNIIALTALAKAVGVKRRNYVRQAWIPVVVFLGLGWLDLPKLFCVSGHCYGQGALIATHARWYVTMLNWGYYLSDTLMISMAIIIAIAARKVVGGSQLAPSLMLVVSLLLFGIGDVLFNYTGLQRSPSLTMYRLEDGLYVAAIFGMLWTTLLLGRIIERMFVGLDV